MKHSILLLVVSLLFPVFSQAEEFPGRATYPAVKVYETAQLNQDFANVIMVDVRSEYEFDTLHINNALNIPLNSKSFRKDLAALQNQNKPIVFYCNGHTCYKSYKAWIKADKAGINNIYAYDSGVFDWAKAHPEKATMLGKTPVNTNHLLSKKELEKYLLQPKDFTAKVDESTLILDIREPSQRGLIELFPYRQENISLDNKKNLDQFLNKVKQSGKTLLVYDESGKQVRWLQYYLIDKGIQNYFFMAGGLKQYFKDNKS